MESKLEICAGCTTGYFTIASWSPAQATWLAQPAIRFAPEATLHLHLAGRSKCGPFRVGGFVCFAPEVDIPKAGQIGTAALRPDRRPFAVRRIACVEVPLADTGGK